ncbi:MAG: hypothetical protein J5793_02095 [Clostridia bacterium]|nr:hypothetical protein [Clostridia bacterium]
MTPGIFRLAKYLPARIAKAVLALPEELAGRADELRLRLYSASSLTCANENICFDGQGNLCAPAGALKATPDELAECLSRLSGGSLYTCGESIAKGFIPLREGGRAGVCGRALTENGKTTGFAEITSVDLRIHRFIKNAAKPLIERFAGSGVKGALVISPPGGGKTTFLRSAAWMLGNGDGIRPTRVAVADEREEIGVSLPRGGIIDLLSGAPKAEAITVLTRSLAPEVIVCDEISFKEYDALTEVQNCGAALIASLHGVDFKGALLRPGVQKLLSAGAFGYAVNLSRNAVPEVVEL